VWKPDPNPQADELLISAWQWLSSSSSILYEPAIHRLLHTLMKKVRAPLLGQTHLLAHLLHTHAPVPPAR
jgi:hypothetical protein